MAARTWMGGLAFLVVVGVDLVWGPALTTPAAPVRRVGALPGAMSPEGYLASVRLPASPQLWLWRRRCQRQIWQELETSPGSAARWSEAIRHGQRQDTLWDYWQSRPAPERRRHGLLGAYQDRLAGLRAAQLDSRARELLPALRRGDYLAYRQLLARNPGGGSAFQLMLNLKSQAPIGPDDMLPFPVWWQWQADGSNQLALEKLLDHLGRSRAPWRWIAAGPDGQPQQGVPELSVSPLGDPVENSYQSGDWIYRYR